MTIKYGKAKLKLLSEGCIDCGTAHAEKWISAKKVEIVVGKKKFATFVHRCGVCQNGRALGVG